MKRFNKILGYNRVCQRNTCENILLDYQQYFCSRNCREQWQRTKEVILNRFWSDVDIQGEDDCWIFRNGKTYGYFHYMKGERLITVVASRFMWMITYGKIPKGLFVCHSCDNPPCVNPHHLFLGTQQDNIDDMISKGRNSRLTALIKMQMYINEHYR